MRKRLMPMAALVGAIATMPLAPASAAPVSPGPSAALLDDLSERTFRFFWETANPANGLVPDRDRKSVV